MCALLGNQDINKLILNKINSNNEIEEFKLLNSKNTQPEYFINNTGKMIKEIF